jgi:hypothetical protein
MGRNRGTDGPKQGVIFGYGLAMLGVVVYGGAVPVINKWLPSGKLA